MKKVAGSRLQRCLQTDNIVMSPYTKRLTCMLTHRCSQITLLATSAQPLTASRATSCIASCQITYTYIACVTHQRGICIQVYLPIYTKNGGTLVPTSLNTCTSMAGPVSYPTAAAANATYSTPFLVSLTDRFLLELSI